MKKIVTIFVTLLLILINNMPIAAENTDINFYNKYKNLKLGTKKLEVEKLLGKSFILDEKAASYASIDKKINNAFGVNAVKSSEYKKYADLSFVLDRVHVYKNPTTDEYIIIQYDEYDINEPVRNKTYIPISSYITYKNENLNVVPLAKTLEIKPKTDLTTVEETLSTKGLKISESKFGDCYIWYVKPLSGSVNKTLIVTFSKGKVFCVTNNALFQKDVVNKVDQNMQANTIKIYEDIKLGKNISDYELNFKLAGVGSSGVNQDGNVLYNPLGFDTTISYFYNINTSFNGIIANIEILTFTDGEIYQKKFLRGKNYDSAPNCTIKADPKKIKIGMTYDEVTNIMTSKGFKSLERDMLSRNELFEVYNWYNDKFDIYVRFSNGKVAYEIYYNELWKPVNDDKAIPSATLFKYEKNTVTKPSNLSAEVPSLSSIRRSTKPIIPIKDYKIKYNGYVDKGDHNYSDFKWDKEEYMNGVKIKDAFGWNDNVERIADLAYNMPWKTKYELMLNLYRIISKGMVYDKNRADSLHVYNPFNYPDDYYAGALYAADSGLQAICFDYAFLYCQIAAKFDVQSQLIGPKGHLLCAFLDPDTKRWVAVDPTWSEGGNMHYFDFNPYENREYVYIRHDVLP